MEEVEFPPLSAGKMAVALAISLVDTAYCLGAVTDDRRQTLQQELQSIQIEFDRAAEQLIKRGFPIDPDLFRYVSQGIWRFRAAVEEIEDAIDEINYQLLEEEVGTSISKLVKRKLFNKFSRLDVPLSNMKRLRNALGINLDVYFTIKLQLLTDSAATGLQPYGYPSWLPTAEDNYGHKQVKEDLVQLLTNDDKSEGTPFSVCALIGNSEDGKSTLAANVSEDPRVLAHFEFIIRIFVPYCFSTEEVIKLILEKLGSSQHSEYERIFLAYNLMKVLENRKFLLILDQIHNESDTVENIRKLVTILRNCKKGVKILLTTKYQSVVDGIGSAIGTLARVIYLKNRLPSRVSSEDYSQSAPSNVPSSLPKDNPRYPSWISNGGIFGRNREREQIIQWLSMDTTEDRCFSVYALVGMAGMGKTTIANIVSQDPRVVASFEAVVWVPVSIDFDTEAMARIILERITGRPPPHFSTYLLLETLIDTLRHSKVLLILDDVWEDSNVDKWSVLVAPLRVCKKGSKILLTTRMQSVVDMVGVAVRSRVECLRIDELNENDNFMLFKSHLPSQLDSEYYDNLLLIGEQIVKKNWWMPLVTSLVASWLGSHMDTHHWNTVLQKGWHHLEEKCIVFSSLRLSYDCLQTQLQACFRYCSLLPKGYKFNKVELAKMWSGSGLTVLENVDLRKTKYVDLLSAEHVGEEQFDVLARKSFFYCMLETETSDGNQQEYYVLHGLMHDLAEHVSKCECARVDYGDLRSISNTTRHLSVTSCSDFGVVVRHLMEISYFNYLRALIVQIEFGLDQETELLLGGLLKKSRSLRLLYMGVPSLSCALDSISSLIHLRYLFLLSCDNYHLQKVLELYHLQVFKLGYLLTIKGANCIDAHSLRCLRSLHVPDSMSSRIQNIGRLTFLKELHGFEAVKNNDQRLYALGNLRSLCQLTLRNLQNVLNVKEVVAIKLKDKHYLKLLSLSWNKHLTDSVDQNGTIIDNLEPNKELHLLHIHGYSGIKLPVWIQNSSLVNLVRLNLSIA